MTAEHLTADNGHMHEPVAAQLAIDIIDGCWKTGEARTLEDIQTEFEVSRTVAREAARLLEAAQAIEIRRRVGLVPRSPADWQALNPQVITWKLRSTQRRQELMSLTELRLCIEPAAARLAAERAALDDKAKLPVMALQMKDAGEHGRLEEFHDTDIAFHTLILRSCGNELFAAFSNIVATILRGRVEINMYPSQPRPEALAAHIAVAEAIWRGEAQAAYEAMQGIVDEVGDAIREQPRK